MNINNGLINKNDLTDQLEFYKDLGVVVKNRQEAQEKLQPIISSNRFFIWNSESSPGSLGIHFKRETLPSLIHPDPDAYPGVKQGKNKYSSLQSFIKKIQGCSIQLSTQKLAIDNNDSYDDLLSIINIVIQNFKGCIKLSHLRLVSKNFYNTMTLPYFTEKVENTSFNALSTLKKIHILSFIGHSIFTIGLTEYYISEMDSDIKEIARHCPHLKQLNLMSISSRYYDSKLTSVPEGQDICDKVHQILTTVLKRNVKVQVDTRFFYKVPSSAMIQNFVSVQNNALETTNLPDAPQPSSRKRKFEHTD